MRISVMRRRRTYWRCLHLGGLSCTETYCVASVNEARRRDHLNFHTVCAVAWILIDLVRPCGRSFQVDDGT